MTLEHLKKQAKNAQKLLDSFGVAPSVKLAQAQEFVARLHGYPSWHDAVESLKDEKAAPKKTTLAPEYWMLRYQEFAKDEVVVGSEIRIIDGVADALSIFWHTFAAFDERLDFPGDPDKFSLTLEPCKEPNALSSQCLQLRYVAIHRSIVLVLYPIDPIVMMIDGPYSKPSAEMQAILTRVQGPEDIETVFEAAHLTYDYLHSELSAYYAQNPAKAVFRDLDKYLHNALKEKAASSGPREGIWSCDVWRDGRWRFSLKYLTAADCFYFDIFDEGGGFGSFIAPTETAAIKRKASGQWVAGPFKGRDKQVVLTGIGDASMNNLRGAARDWGVAFVLDGITEFSSVENGTAPGHLKFIQWLREKHPDALAGGKYDT